MNLRIKGVRKYFKKTQKEFGESLGVSRDTFASYESGRVEPSRTFVQLLCTTYRVSEEWLGTGQGDMFVQTKQSFVEKLAAEYGLSFTAQKIVECYLNLEEEQRSAVDGFIMSVAESLVEPSVELEEADIVDEAIDKTIGIYRAATSATHTEHEVIPDGQSTIEKLKKAKPDKVASTDDF